MTGISLDSNNVLSGGLEEGGPTGARLEFGVAHEKDSITDDAAVSAVVVAIPVIACEGAFGAGLLSHRVLLRDRRLRSSASLLVISVMVNRPPYLMYMRTHHDPEWVLGPQDF